jgi:hypothetical protein
MVAGHEVYSFLDDFLSYHQIMITLEDRYKTTSIIDWGTFVWIVMPFGLKNVPPTYQQIVNMAFCEYLEVFIKLFWITSMYSMTSNAFCQTSVMF